MSENRGRHSFPIGFSTTWAKDSMDEARYPFKTNCQGPKLGSPSFHGILSVGQGTTCPSWISPSWHLPRSGGDEARATLAAPANLGGSPLKISR